MTLALYGPLSGGRKGVGNPPMGVGGTSKPVAWAPGLVGVDIPGVRGGTCLGDLLCRGPGVRGAGEGSGGAAVTWGSGKRGSGATCTTECVFQLRTSTGASDCCGTGV